MLIKTTPWMHDLARTKWSCQLLFRYDYDSHLCELFNMFKVHPTYICLLIAEIVCGVYIITVMLYGIMKITMTIMIIMIIISIMTQSAIIHTSLAPSSAHSLGGMCTLWDNIEAYFFSREPTTLWILIIKTHWPGHYFKVSIWDIETTCLCNTHLVFIYWVKRCILGLTYQFSNKLLLDTTPW